MTSKKHRCNLVKTEKSREITAQESITVQDEKPISAILAHYATKGRDFTGMSADEKKQQEGKLYQATKLLTDALGAKGLIEHLLSTQLLDIHELQQKLIVYANRSMHSPEENQFYINAVNKLSNVFVSQITLLQKLQGQTQQKVTVEHLHVHQGAQAIVGQVNAKSMGVANEK
jgi:hypothetical protein